MISTDYLTELKRKFFHLSALFYVAGISILPRKTFVILMVGLVVLVTLFEVARLKNSRINKFIENIFGKTIREKEKKHLSGVFWMTLGVLSTALLIGPTEVAVTILLYLILGDAAASLIGKKIKGKEIGKTGKRWSGSLACFITCLVIGSALMRPDYAWHGIILGALAATILEMGFIPINDNFLIPVGSSITMMVSYSHFFG